jgi:hypothetical protein
MIARSLYAWILIPTMVLFQENAFSSDIFASLHLETEAGYEGNRFIEAGPGDGAAFLSVNPGLDIATFGMATETALLLNYRRTQYQERPAGSKDEASAALQGRYFTGRNEFGARSGTGLYQDLSLPEDDTSFWHLRPYWERTLESWPFEIGLSGSYLRTSYDSAINVSGEGRSDEHAELRPCARWHASRHATLWTDFYLENHASNVREAEYTGTGGTIGSTLEPAPRLHIDVWTGIGFRQYRSDLEDTEKEEIPWRAGGSMTYRCRPWLEFFAVADGESINGSPRDIEYSWWRVAGGIRVVLEQDMGAQR